MDSVMGTIAWEIGPSRVHRSRSLSLRLMIPDVYVSRQTYPTGGEQEPVLFLRICLCHEHDRCCENESGDDSTLDR